MSKSVTELRIINGEKNIFDLDREYIIPLYQRAFAWEDKQLNQLVEDILDINEGSNYYIGALIVSKKEEKYEVVDGQQRLTSLYLLLNCLGIDTKNTLTFACREKSNYTLKNIRELLKGASSKIDMDNVECGIMEGIKILNQAINKKDFDKDVFIKKLSKVVIYRIEVPEHTDLNRYFEIMNTRGEQLEQHDILKAKLMSYLPLKDQYIFAKKWDACSDMTGYVQMHFISKKNTDRENIFGLTWEEMPSRDWSYYKNLDSTENNQPGNSHIISDIIKPGFTIDDDGYVDDDVRVRFESIIEFPYFLIHTLKVFIKLNNVTHEDGESTIIAELLDDKKLIEAFSNVINHGCIDGRKIFENKEDFSGNFIVCLLRTRYLFDKYIIKREYKNENSEGEWSLKSLFVSGQGSNKKPYYRNSEFKKLYEQTKTNDRRTKKNIMIQSALRVSYTSPKVMHWITKLLIWLSENDCEHTGNDMVNYSNIAEYIAKTAVRENFLNISVDKYTMGVNTPHIVFNYLDYIIWRDHTDTYKDFTFEFRNSVEHWYPQHPSEGSFDKWDNVDCFGNLCIVQRNINSKFSNMSPEAKKSTFKEMISKGSLKLRIMSKLTERHENTDAIQYWKETACQAHQNDMIEMLKKECESSNKEGESSD